MKNFFAKKGVILGLVSAFVLVFALCMVGTNNASKERYDGRLPFFIEKKLNSTISRYLEEYPVRNQVFVTAPYRYGKTRLLSHISEKLVEQGRLVLYLNLENVETKEDFLHMFRVSAIRGFLAIKSTISNAALKRIGQVKRTPHENLTEAYELPQQMKMLYEGLYANLEDLFDNFSTRHLHEINRYLRSSAAVLKPVVIIEGFDKLLQSKKYEKYYSNLHIIDGCQFLIELHDSSVKLDKEFINSHRFIEIRPAKRTAESVLVHKNDVFSYSEYRKIVSVFGEHPGTFSDVKESLKFGTKIDDAINIEINQTNAMINVALSELSIKKGSLPICSNKADQLEAMGGINAYLPLIKKGYIYITNDMKIIAANKAIHHALCD